MKVLKEDCQIGQVLNQVEELLNKNCIIILPGVNNSLTFYIKGTPYKIINTDDKQTRNAFPRTFDNEVFVPLEEIKNHNL